MSFSFITKIFIFFILTQYSLYSYTSIKYERTNKVAFDYSYSNASSLFLRSGELAIDNIQRLTAGSSAEGDFTSSYNFNSRIMTFSLEGTYLLTDKLNLNSRITFQNRFLDQTQTIRYVRYEFGNPQIIGKNDLPLDDENENIFSDFQIGASYFAFSEKFYLIFDSQLFIPFGFDDGQFGDITNEYLGDGALKWINGFRLGNMFDNSFAYLQSSYIYRDEDFRDQVLIAAGLEHYKIEDVIVFGKLEYLYTINGFIDGYDVRPHLNNIQEDYLQVLMGIQMNFDNLNFNIAYNLKPIGRNTLNNSVIHFRASYLFK